MKKKKLFASLLLPMWLLSSFAAGPSKTLTITDQFATGALVSVRESIGIDVNFSGKVAASENGNLMLLLSEPVFWTYVNETGETISSDVSVFEYNQANGKIIAGYPVSAPVSEEGSDEEGEPEPPSLQLTDLVYDASNGVYLGLDAEHQKIYAFEYGPDQPKTVMVEKTRMVEVIVPPESLLDTEVSQAEQPVEAVEVDSAELNVSPESEPVIEVIEENTSTVLQESNTTVDAVGLAVMQAPVQDSPEMVEVETEAVEAIVEDTTDAIEEVSENVEEVVETTGLDAEEDAEIVVETVEELPEVIEEIVEDIVPVTKMVEESYEEAVTVMEPHKFREAVAGYDLAALELQNLTDLYYDAQASELYLIALNADEQRVIQSIQMDGNEIVSEEPAIVLGVEADVEAAMIDPLTLHWVVVSRDGVTMHSRDGRLLRQISESTSVKDFCAYALMDENGEKHFKHINSTSNSFGALVWSRPAEAKIHHIPGEFVSIQDAVDAAKPNDWVLVSPGEYDENIVIAGKTIQVVSYFQLTGELYFLENTVLLSSSGVTLTVGKSADTSVYVSGLQFSGSETAIASEGNLTVENNEILGNQAGIVFAGGTGTIVDSLINENAGSAIAYKAATATLVERCSINENGSHGIEIDITPYDDVLYRTVIRRNEIRNNAGSGIRFNDQPISTHREFRIENNFVVDNAVAGIELALDQPDPKNPIPTGPRSRRPNYMVNNTIVNNPVGVLGTGNFQLINNIIARSSEAGIKNLQYHSAIIRCLFWENEQHAVNSSSFQMSNNVEEDPIFVGDDYILSVRSPAKGRGIPGRLWNDTSDRSGADIGASR